MNDFPLNLLMGMIAGFSVSVPLGPGGLFCIQRTLSKGPRSGLVAGLGAATSDVIYASLAILSLSFIRTLIENNKNLLFLISGMALMIIGLAIFSSNPVKQLRQNRESKKFWEDYLTGLAAETSSSAMWLTPTPIGITGYSREFAYYVIDLARKRRGWTGGSSCMESSMRLTPPP